MKCSIFLTWKISHDNNYDENKIILCSKSQEQKNSCNFTSNKLLPHNSQCSVHMSSVIVAQLIIMIIGAKKSTFYCVCILCVHLTYAF